MSEQLTQAKLDEIVRRSAVKRENRSATTGPMHPDTLNALTCAWKAKMEQLTQAKLDEIVKECEKYPFLTLPKETVLALCEAAQKTLGSSHYALGAMQCVAIPGVG